MNNKIISLALFEEVAERIRNRIFSQELMPGDRIDEQLLTQEFGISRTPLREALKVLQAEGLVTLVPRRGCFVAQLNERDLDDIYATVALLESRCAAEVASTRNDADLKRLRLLLRKLELTAASGTLQRYAEANTEMHEVMQDIAGNRWQKEILQDLRRILKLSRGLTIGLPGRLEDSLREHAELLDAIEQRDAARAEKIMHAHVLRQRDALRQMQDERSEPTALQAANT